MSSTTAPISLNSDMGESLGIHEFGNDDELLTIIDTANVACGFHAGDPSGIRRTVQKAVAAGVTIGAHPGLPDLVGFGRRAMELAVDEVRDIVLYQVGALSGFLSAEGAELHHIKPHGALYGMAARNESLMEAICDVAELYAVPIFGMSGTAHEAVATRRGVRFIAELYVDLSYRQDGSLIIERRPHATDVVEATERARRGIIEGLVETVGGTTRPIGVNSICVHSDTPGAVDAARAVRAVLEETGRGIGKRASTAQ